MLLIKKLVWSPVLVVIISNDEISSILIYKSRILKTNTRFSRSLITVNLTMILSL